MFNEAQFTDEQSKVLYAASFLRGRAARGFAPHLKGYLSSKTGGDDMKDETEEIFGDLTEFEIRMDRLYGIADEEMFADQGIRRLRQTGSVANYTADFNNFAALLEWNDPALRSQFYLGLKDNIKNELATQDPATQLNDLIEKARQLDERFHYRAQEKEARHSFIKKSSYRDSYGAMPMEIDATQRKKLSSREKARRSEKRLCFYCAEKGHQARECPEKGDF